MIISKLVGSSSKFLKYASSLPSNPCGSSFELVMRKFHRSLDNEWSFLSRLSLVNEEAVSQRCSVKKGVLRNFTKFTRKHLCQGLFFNRPATLLKKRLWHRRFLWICAIFRDTFFQRTSSVAASVNIKKSTEFADLFLFTKEILHGKLNFLCSGSVRHRKLQFFFYSSFFYHKELLSIIKPLRLNHCVRYRNFT